ncbi:MAG: pyridoxamine 5'-phosphate oxidase family protein [Dehalococcoidia bacterium]|nr:pyridoxamine 5'-phosphate oxidase family protein [Dehalococcoidia bacterium]
MAIELTDEWKQALNSAFVDGCPILWSSTGSDGQSALNFFGSTQTYSDHQLGIWMRTPDRGFLQRISENPKVSMMYRNPATRLVVQIHGEARRADDQETKDRVYNAAPEAEQKADAEKAGTAVIVEITRVVQRGQVVQSRD